MRTATARSAPSVVPVAAEPADADDSAPRKPIVVTVGSALRAPATPARELSDVMSVFEYTLLRISALRRGRERARGLAWRGSRGRQRDGAGARTR